MTRLFSVLTLVWQDVLRDFVLYFPTGVVVAVVVCVGYAIGVTQLHRSKVQPRELAVLFVLAVYVVGGAVYHHPFPPCQGFGLL
ncbi:hypothetical protein [Eubacterium aggregans]|uniref:hypothetical protein n=1 Tax=Eubacterium aggregans TaxID=81409 RepID=UPI003F3934C7